MKGYKMTKSHRNITGYCQKLVHAESICSYMFMGQLCVAKDRVCRIILNIMNIDYSTRLITPLRLEHTKYDMWVIREFVNKSFYISLTIERVDDKHFGIKIYKVLFLTNLMAVDLLYTHVYSWRILFLLKYNI